LVLTHFGITAFECLHAGTAVLLVSPSAYHEKLARRSGFASLGRGTKKLKDSLTPPAMEELYRRCRHLAERYGLAGTVDQSLGDRIAVMDPDAFRICPICGEEKNRTLARFPDRTCRICSRCGMVHLFRSVPPQIRYGGDYFFQEYKRQYGKTYLEDVPGLMQNGRIRLGRIIKLLPPGKRGALLDIGCAYGPFLAAAREKGFSPLGMDPSEEAIRHVKAELNLPGIRGFFPGDIAGIVPEQFTVISLWYVIEHFREPRRVLETIHRLLEPGGIIAFSTPSFSGISRRCSLRTFLEKSPADHRTIWTPRHCGNILAAFGFDLKRIVVTGHHPERFPLFRGKFRDKRGPAYRILYGISRLFGLGDTFEVYAIKRPAGGGGKHG
jgi:SAM-dependent methyltransferase